MECLSQTVRSVCTLLLKFPDEPVRFRRNRLRPVGTTHKHRRNDETAHL